MKKNDVQDSYLPQAWGGPFVYIRNEKGNLVLHAISKLTGAAKELVEALEKRVSR